MAAFQFSSPEYDALSVYGAKKLVASKYEMMRYPTARRTCDSKNRHDLSVPLLWLEYSTEWLFRIHWMQKTRFLD